MKVKLKICGMKMPGNILEIAALQPDYLGFIFYKGSKRHIDGLLPEFVKSLPSEIERTGVFVDEDLNNIVELAELYGLNAVQLHGAEPASYCKDLKELLQEKRIDLIKAFGIDEYFDFNRLEAYTDVVDYFLFDTQTPGHGGSGKTFNWHLLENYTLPNLYFLSGGIGPESIDELNKIKDIRLYAIDVNSKFELAPGLKDVEKLIDFKKQL